MSRVALVTGSNKGLGFGIVKLLCEKNPNWTVYLTSRDVGRGEAAMTELRKLGLSPRYHQLDIDSQESIENLRDHLKKEHGGFDVLINNAAIAYKTASTAPFGEQARVTIATNFFAVLNICNALFPLLRDHARVVNVSGMYGHKAFSGLSEQLKEAFKGCVSQDQVSELISQFVEAAEKGNHQEAGWPNNAYGVSKLGITIATRIQQVMLDADKSRSDLVVNACCPGRVRTDLSGHQGFKTPEQGADTPVYLATLPENCSEPRGKFLSDRAINNMY